ncbi:hypothetical protein LY474_15575 [Myxococcus stipitatus]|uniref:hypothetical protein n=1 Tax=Myxococcus stipitatus TaxID=83455 RepID=UPI001F3C7E92|nr:hypothetical protein [Myxococcus stipitatus]MCE9669230.1 hypothetical protein [Myxococcus stipitatus]
MTSVTFVDGPRGGEGALMNLDFGTPAFTGMQARVNTPPRWNRVSRDPARVRWEAQPWRRQLRDPQEFETPVSRTALVKALVDEGLEVDAEVARFAGLAEDTDCISIAQVVRFSDLLTRRMTLAESDDQLLQLAHLRRNTQDLAERMIDWANSGRL